MNQLMHLSQQIIKELSLDGSLSGWIMVEINNCVWRDIFASIPYDKRILLLPKCLSNSAECKAETDEFGLLCMKCNRCSIPQLQEEADHLGIMSLVAEGFTPVTGLIENRVVEGVIGVGCLESLERVFPTLVSNAVPGIAISLNCAGCENTSVDCGHVCDAMRVLSRQPIHLLDYDSIKQQMKQLFSDESLRSVLSTSDEQTSAIAYEWLSGEGKRWRPYLLISVYMALTGEREIPEKVGLAAIAVECFHKASLIHDDIQDNDETRYGKQTVHSAHGTPMAINVGDLLLGEGYRLLARCNEHQLMTAATEAHITLCKGQGMELTWSESPRKLTMDYVLDIFCRKTAPAFEAALVFGLICAQANEQLHDILVRYSKALGIAYQLLDDIKDFENNQPVALRPSSVLATVCEQNKDAKIINDLLGTADLKACFSTPENKPLLDKAIERVRELAYQYHCEANESLNEIRNFELKRLLFRVTQRILTLKN
jgi:geranylgeranyl pyrophosphate synthase